MEILTIIKKNVIIAFTRGDVMRVVISAGGTGGHIYPALAIINKIKREEPDSEFLYIGTHNRMEKDIVPKLNIPYEGIEITGFKRKLTLDNVKTVINFLKAKKPCMKLVREFKPDVVIGCGGYVTVPVILAGKKLGYKTFIHEQNSVVGLSNKYLSKYADKIGVSFESTLSEFPKNKVVLTGNPCSEKAIATKSADLSEYGLTNDKKLVLIVMGSLGSKTINDKMIDYVYAFRNKSYQVIYVTGNGYYDKVKNRVFPDNVKVVPFIQNLPAVMKCADLMVSRAGASTISEITALGIPTVFIPSPYVTNNHQYVNAKSLEDDGACIILKEEDFNKDSLVNLLDKTLNDKEKLKCMKSALLKRGVTDSATRIYEEILKLVRDE